MPKLSEPQVRAIIKYYSAGSLYRLDPCIRYYDHPQSGSPKSDILVALGLYETLMFSMPDPYDMAEPIRVILEQ